MRKHYIEYLRVIAMFAVVAIHVCIAGLSSFANHSMFDAVFYSSVRNIFHFAVPVFFMISGALMLSPSKDLPIKNCCAVIFLNTDWLSWYLAGDLPPLNGILYRIPFL